MNTKVEGRLIRKINILTMTNVLKKTSIVGLVAATVAALGLVLTPAVADAQTANQEGNVQAQTNTRSGGFSSSLTNLIVLEELFDGDLTDGETTYTVRPGDTLSQIASMFDTSVSAIARANNISNPNMIFVGEELTIPEGNRTTSRGSSDTLRDLIVLQGLFGGDMNMSADSNISGNFSTGLRDLIILEELFSDNDSGNLFGDGDNTLRDLILIQGLFGNGNSSGWFN